MTERSLDALVVTSLPNITYLTNFRGSSAIAVLTHERLLFITDFRYTTVLADTQATAWACPELEVVTAGGSYDATLAGVLTEVSGRHAGFEAAHLTVSRHRWLTAQLASRAAALELVATEGLIERARVIKDSYEIAVLSEAARRLSEVASATFADVQAGRTERDVAAAIDRRLRTGFEKPGFETIVAAGPNAALPRSEN
jgi:Xaa-Pro aminopeptidase